MQANDTGTAPVVTRIGPAAAILLVLTAAAGAAKADEVVRKKGKPLRGTVFREGDVVRAVTGIWGGADAIR